MFTQPSVNQIASTYQGNPAPLAQKVNADKKQNGGIPQDLRQLLALNDITQGRNAMGIQQALQTPTNMPTVAQDLQERARQAMQARQMQAVQEQMRKDGKPNVVPMGTPRPPMQPQGIDALESNVGEGYADGGIIGHTQHFEGKTGSEVKDPAEENKSWIERFLYSNISPAERARKDALESQAEAGRTVPTKLNEERDRAMAEVNRAQPNKTQETFERLGMSTRQEQPTQQVIGQTPPAPPKADVPSVVKPRVNADSAPMPGGLKDLVSTVATPGGDYQRKMLGQDEEALAAAKRAAFLKEVGNRDLSVYDETAKELKARKERLNAPKAGYDATMEYLAQIAQGGGRNWMEAGSRGAASQNALQKQRQAEQDLLMEKILDVGAKKAEAQYGEKKGLFELTQAEKDRIIKDKLEVAKQLNLSEDKTRQLVEEGIQKELDRKNRITTQSMANHDNLMSRAKALMAADPTKKMTLEQAMQRAGEIGAAGQMESAEVRKLKAYDDALKNLNAESKFMGMLLDKKNKPENAALRAEYENRIKELQGRYGVAGQGINALPSAGGPTSSNVRSQADSIIAGGR